MGFETLTMLKKSRKCLNDNYNWLKKRQFRTGAHAGGLRGLAPLPNGNRLNTNLLLTCVKTQNNSAHAYIAI